MARAAGTEAVRVIYLEAMAQGVRTLAGSVGMKAQFPQAEKMRGQS